ncbi:PRA1 family protein-domain-containing protein [Xylariaceae sp. FL0804]|nr:PRA1 family protein-domain-containing protein [Xylariaceae sp. FL0804]
MARIQIPLDVLTSRLNIQDRFSGFRNTSLSSRFANMRPVGEFLDFKRLSKPANFGEVQSRVNYNLVTFSSNYALVFVILSIYALITNPLLLFDIVLLVAGLWLLGRLNGQDLTIGSFHATSSQLYTGLLCTCGLLFLIASPFSTVLWLIGASGGLGGRPRAPKYAPQWGRPSRRGKRRWPAPQEEEDPWNTAHRVVEELDSDDTDTQGVGLAAPPGNRRFVSDPLRFTGIDLGSGGRPRNNYTHQRSDDDELTEDDSQATSEDDEEGEPQTSGGDAVEQAALLRIRKAQEKGKHEVKLNKQELAALERRQKRLQAEAEAARRDAERRKRKEKEQRYAVPLSHFDTSLHGRTGGPSISDSALPRQPLPSTMVHNQARPGPPMGLFPPPNVSQTRPRSATSSSHRSRPPSSHSGSGRSSPFDYQYVSASSNHRHVSDTARPSSSRLSLPREDEWRPQSSSSTRNAHDPFQYMTAGPRAPYPYGAAAARMNMSGSSDMVSYSTLPRRVAPAAARSSSEETSEGDGDDTTSDDQGNGVQIAQNRHREEVIVVEPSSDHEPEPTAGRSKGKKSSPANPSPVKRKPVSGGRRRKGK